MAIDYVSKRYEQEQTERITDLRQHWQNCDYIRRNVEAMADIGQHRLIVVEVGNGDPASRGHDTDAARREASARQHIAFVARVMVNNGTCGRRPELMGRFSNQG